MPGIVWPDVEAVLVQYLSAALAARDEPFTDGVIVGHALPTTRPARAVIVRDDGGPELGDVRAISRIGVNVWAQNDADVADLANLVVALVKACPDGAPIVKATVTRPYSIADDSRQPLRYFTAELVVRGVDL